jgi:hypothetical protein
VDLAQVLACVSETVYVDDRGHVRPGARAQCTYDLYSKADERPDVARLRPYYEELIGEFFPAQIAR